MPKGLLYLILLVYMPLSSWASEWKLHASENECGISITQVSKQTKSDVASEADKFLTLPWDKGQILELGFSAIYEGQFMSKDDAASKNISFGRNEFSLVPKHDVKYKNFSGSIIVDGRDKFPLFPDKSVWDFFLFLSEKDSRFVYESLRSGARVGVVMNIDGEMYDIDRVESNRFGLMAAMHEACMAYMSHNNSLKVDAEAGPALNPGENGRAP